MDHCLVAEIDEEPMAKLRMLHCEEEPTYTANIASYNCRIVKIAKYDLNNFVQ